MRLSDEDRIVHILNLALTKASRLDWVESDLLLHIMKRAGELSNPANVDRILDRVAGFSKKNLLAKHLVLAGAVDVYLQRNDPERALATAEGLLYFRQDYVQALLAIAFGMRNTATDEDARHARAELRSLSMSVLKNPWPWLGFIRSSAKRPKRPHSFCKHPQMELAKEYSVVLIPVLEAARRDAEPITFHRVLEEAIPCRSTIFLATPEKTLWKELPQ